MNDHANFDITRKKHQVIGVITTYTSQDIHFHSSKKDWPHAIWKKLTSLFYKFDESQVMQIEKELISLDPQSFERIEDYLAHVKELQYKLGKCENNFLKKD